jgi:hypothetical protein
MGIRDKVYENMSYKTSSILRIKKVANSIKQAFNIKGDITTVNEFLEILDRAANKKGKPKLEKDIDISLEAEASTKLGIALIKEMEQRDLTPYEKLEKEKLELELKLADYEIEYEQFEQLLANIQLKQDRLSRTAPVVTDTPKTQKETIQIGESIS